jgi:hypothetical protein
LHRILARITTNTQTRQRSKVPPQLPFFGARERNRNGAHSRRAKKTKTHTSSWHDDDGVVSCSFLKSCGLFHHFLLLCVCCRPFYFYFSLFGPFKEEAICRELWWLKWSRPIGCRVNEMETRLGFWLSHSPAREEEEEEEEGGNWMEIFVSGHWSGTASYNNNPEQ